MSILQIPVPEWQNFTKEFAHNVFFEQGRQHSFKLEYIVPDSDPVLTISLIQNTTPGQKWYYFTITSGKEVYFENPNKKNKGISMDEVFDAFYNHPDYKKYKSKLSTEVTFQNLDIDEFDVKEYEDEFAEFINPLEDSYDVLHGDKQTITPEEFTSFITKALTDPNTKKRLDELRDLNQKIDYIRKNAKEFKSVPDELFELSTKAKGQVSYLERVIINKCKKAIIEVTMNNIHLQSDWIKEFDTRFFDYNIHKDISPVWGVKVPLEENLLRFIELTINNPKLKYSNKEHSWRYIYDERLWTYIYHTFNPGLLERDLGWEFTDILAFVVGRVKNSIYFFRPEQQEVDIKLSTYVYSAVERALGDLRNYTDRIDSSGGISRWKDKEVITKLRKVQAKLAELRDHDTTNNPAYQYNFDNVKRVCEEEKMWLTDADIHWFMYQLGNRRQSLDDIQGDEGEEMENATLHQELWETTGAGTQYDPTTRIDEQMKVDKLQSHTRKLFSDDLYEQLVFEALLEKISEKPQGLGMWKNALKLPLTTINSYITSLELDDVPLLSQQDLDVIIERVYYKIINQRDVLQMILTGGQVKRKKDDEINLDEEELVI